jgi:probable rRNA maturation factor
MKVSVRDVKRIAKAALQAEGVPGGLAVRITRDDEMRQLNRRYRGKDKPTNVLSFPAGPAAGESAYLGDVAISIDYVDRQGARTGAGFRYTFAYYLVHGILHLLGHDHHHPADARRMYRRTRQILELAGEG